MTELKVDGDSFFDRGIELRDSELIARGINPYDGEQLYEGVSSFPDNYQSPMIRAERASKLPLFDESVKLQDIVDSIDLSSELAKHNGFLRLSAEIDSKCRSNPRWTLLRKALQGCFPEVYGKGARMNLTNAMASRVWPIYQRQYQESWRAVQNPQRGS